jgi:tRNA modification GTPase
LSDTIYALSSGSGTAGVAVIRISGPRVPAIISSLGLGQLTPRTARLARIFDPVSRDAIDTALVLYFPAPRSYTGEDLLELHVHGGRAVVAAVLAALSQIEGCRLAEAGEFTRRAFHNGKLDLTEAEGLADLIAAQTEAQRRQAVKVAGGVLRELYEGWRTQLIQAMALMEASLDFSDEADVADDAITQARSIAISLRAAIASHLDDKRRGEILRDGLIVVIAGPPNAGKSSLLNALARRDVAIVSSEPGTTRDVIEARLDLGGYPVIVSDTAGIRAEPSGGVEAEGIRRSFARSAEANLILWLIDAGDPVIEPPQELLDQDVEIIRVLSKADLGRPAAIAASIALSTRTGEGLSDLLKLINRRAADQLEASESPLITTPRQRALVTETLGSLDGYLGSSPDQPELGAEDLRQAARSLGRITGRVDVEDVLDRVFGAFCIGK